MRIKTVMKCVAVLFLALFIHDTASASSSVIDNVASYFQNLEFSSHKTSIQKKHGTEKNKNAVIIEKLPGAARIITGISMRIGLSDDSIPVDQLIPELLNLKSIQLKDLENFSDKTVNQFVDEIFKVKTGLNDLAKDTEQAFAHVDTVRKVWKTVGDLKTLPKTLDLNPVSKWNFSKFQNVRAKNNFDLTSFLQAVKAAPSLEDISPVMKVLDSLIPFYSFVNLMEYVNSYSSIFQQYSTNKDNFDSNINRLSSLELKSKDLQVMTEIAKSRVHPKWFNRQVTSGFVDGFLDLEKMENDISDTWIQNALKSEVSFDGLRGLSKLKTEIMALDNMWKVLFKKEDYKNIQLIGKLQSKSDKIASASDFKRVASTVASCNLMSNVKGTEYVRVLTDNLLKLQKTVFAIQTIHQELKKINIEEIKKVPQKASSLIQKISHQIAILEKTNFLNKTSNLVSTYGKFITEFHTDSMTTNYIKHIECISKATGNIEEVASTAELLVGIRKLGKKPEIKKISSSVSKSVKPIASIRKVIEEIKEDSSKEVNELMPFKNLQTYSKPFGDAVTVSMTMMGVSKRKQSLINIAENWHVVEEALETSDFEFRNTWADHHSILRNITQIINVLDNWEKKTQNLQSTDLQAIGPHVANLTKLQDFDIGPAHLASFNKLISGTADREMKNKLEKIKIDLDKLSELDLKFSQYQSSLISMPETMSQIVSIFESEKDEVMFDEEQINTNGMAPEQINFLIGVGCLLVILLVVGTIWCYYDYKCLFWDLKNRYYKPKGSVKTAREGGVSGGGARKKTTNSNRRADGREDRKKPSNDSVLLTPPPPPVNRTSTVSSNLNTQKESSKQSTVEGKTQRTTKDSVKTDTDTL